MKLTISSSDKPLRDIVLNRDDLLKHAVELAHAHNQSGVELRGRSLLPRIGDNMRFLQAANREVTDYVKRTRDMAPAAEWFLDNYYLLKDLKQQIESSLPSKYERQLPVVKGGYLRGFPRIFALMVELIEHTDSHVNGDTLKAFINAYQGAVPLSSGELWAIPVMLRIALLENIRRLVQEVVFTQREREAAEKWLAPIIRAEQGVEGLEDLLDANPRPEVFSPAFAERLLRRFRELGPEGAPILRWFDKVLAKQNAEAEGLAKSEHRRQAMCQVSVGHAITSLRFLGEEDWPRFFEDTSAVHRILQEDPSGTYTRMDFDSRDKYRHKIEKLARKYGVSELAVARMVLELAQNSASFSGLPHSHVGYYLLGPGCLELEQQLEREWGPLRHFWCSLVRLIRHNPVTVYFGSIALISWAIVYSLVSYVVLNSSIGIGWGIALVAVMIIPASSIAITLVNWGVTRILPPSFFPKLELAEGIPENLRTIVVIPTFLSSVPRVQELLNQLEVYFLANQEQNLHFALLGDFVDAKEQQMPTDQTVLNAAVAGVEDLNRKYGQGKFYLFNRRRQWNAAEGLWMGWERKRGKLIEFNRLVLGSQSTSYNTQLGDMSLLSKIRYVITLDSDTYLPRGLARKLVGTMAHPLHIPQISEDGKRVIKGYGILQPRIGVSLQSAGVSLFARVFSGKAGVDPYTTAVSDVYQDLFGEGCFTGKGIYDLEVFNQVTGDAFPENTVLSHDLLEGLYARTGLVTDLELIDGYPAKYHAYLRRMHRWVRGDWQIVAWLFKDLPFISKWKIFDNLRRSLEAVAQLVLILLAFALAPGQPWVWFGLVLLNLLLPGIIAGINHLLAQGKNPGQLEVRDYLVQFILLVAFIPYQAYIEIDAIVRSLTRLFISHRQMLEWETAADTERRVDTRQRTSWFLMWPIVAGLLGVSALLAIYSPAALEFAPLALIWLFSPWLAYRISLPIIHRNPPVSAEDKKELRIWARKIWAFFEDFIAAEDNWLPPDNVQIDPPNGVAHRTSPTNIGLALLANLSARDLGYLSLSQVCERIEKTLGTMEKVEGWKGHLFNWYDTQSLKPLQPLYVSTVDSGNLVIYCLTLSNGLKDLLEKPVFDQSLVSGLADTCDLALAEVDAGERQGLKEFGLALDEMLRRSEFSLREWHQLLEKWGGLTAGMPAGGSLWLQRMDKMIQAYKEELQGFFVESLAWENGGQRDLDNLSLRELVSYYDFKVKNSTAEPGEEDALARISQLVRRIEDLSRRLRARALETDFAPLYDQNRQLFSIGYRLEDRSLDKSYYDLLASEARQASYIAIAKGDVPQSHWYRLGRTLTRVKGHRCLASWSGTMFEFLMPLLVMRNYRGTLLDETYQSVVAAQRKYGVEHAVPWGISESGYYLQDAQGNYQYKAFGVPGLGLKRGLIQDLVIAPYATFMSLMVAPHSGLNNLRLMRGTGFDGPYGLFEAVDYTSGRVPVGRSYALVQSYMAHHLGMSFLALDNVLFSNVMQERFHGDAMVQASELLLQERVPGYTQINPQPEERHSKAEAKELVEGKRFVSLSTADSMVPVTHFLSNGRYSLMVTNSGSGFSRLGETFVSRWREDVTQDNWGMYFYIQNLNSGGVWSAAHHPWGDSGQDYKITYAPDRIEFCRRDGNIGTKTEIVVSPEDNVEIRRISLTNHSQHERILEITSYFEVLLTRLSDDLAHPAFSNLFVQTEFTHQALLATRRHRRDDQSRQWLMHTVIIEGEEAGALQYETDRARFIGRGRDLGNPLALEPNHPLSNTTGAVLDPIMSLRQRVRVRPGKTVRVCFSIGMGESREEALSLAEKYRDVDSVERVFELAWTYSQVELRHLGLSPSEANEALNLGGNLLYLSPCRRDIEEILGQNSKGQSSLWPYAISGDLPVVLVRVKETTHLDLVRQFLVVHEYWRSKGLLVDLVIMNEEKGSYLQTFHNALKELVSVGHARELLNRPGGIFLLQGENMPAEDVTLLSSVARIIFSGQGGSCAVQMRRQGKLLIRDAAQEPERGIKPRGYGETVCPNQAWDRVNNLLYFNGYGGFTPDGKEYVIELKHGAHTPLPWVNVIANPGFGFHVSESGSGYTWSGNSRENKLTPWFNDPIIDPPGEVIYLRDETSGEFWSPTPGPVPGGESYAVRHGQGYSVFEHVSHGLGQQLLMFVPIGAPVKIMTLKLNNFSSRPRRLTATYYMEPVLGVARQLTAPYLVSEFDQERRAMLFRNTYQEEFSGRYGFIHGAGGRVLSYTGDRTEFIGRNNSLQNPAAMLREQLSDVVGAGMDPCGAIQLEVEIEPGGEKQLHFLLGEVRGRERASEMIDAYREQERVRSALDQMKAYWDSCLGTVQVETPDKAMDLLLNRWLLYQTIVCRLWARSAFYQSGGAYGFRDQLQDVLALIPAVPEWTRQQIILHCGHQFSEGDVQHWWHPERSKGIRTKFSDDLLWLPYVTAHYLERTLDYGLLEERINFLEDEPLGDEEDERYSIPRVSQESGTVYEHCIRAIERGLRFGMHGLPLIGSGDWNDGFSRIGVKGRGESVWLGWFLYLTLQKFARICEERKDSDRAERYRLVCSKLQESLERNGWDGGWYRRAYFDDGTPLGSAGNEECQIDCIAQAWAVISGAARPSRAEDAMLALEHYLLRREEGMLLLLTPPFDRAKPDPGYIKGYVPGVRENGGQYTHGAIWSIFAWTQMGHGDKAAEVFQLLNPVNHARTEGEAARYKVEPYVMAADVYATPLQVGRGGWSWYTGAAGWMYQAGLEAILGLRLRGNRLQFEPCIPSHWPGYKLDYRYKNTLYKISVENPEGKMRGVGQLLLDGQEVDEVLLWDDGKTHEVKVIIKGEKEKPPSVGGIPLHLGEIAGSPEQLYS